MSEPSDRNSFAELGSHVVGGFRAVIKSKTLITVLGLAFTALTSLYAYIGGWDAGIARVADLDKLSEAIGKQAIAIESQGKSIQAQGKQISTLADALRETSQAHSASLAAERARLDKEVLEDQKREAKMWRAVVLSNAPKNKSGAYEERFSDLVGEGYAANVAAYMTLGWGRLR